RPRRAGGTGTRFGSGVGQDAAVGARVGQALVAVVPAHQVRRLAVAAAHLEDLALAARLSDLATLDDDPVARLRAHAITSFAVLTSPGGQHYRPSRRAAGAVGGGVPCGPRGGDVGGPR